MNLLLLSVIFFGIFILFASFFIVKQETAVIIERLGKFQVVRYPGIHFKIPVIDQVEKRLNLRIQQLDVVIDTKTEDNVFVKMKVSIQYKVIEGQAAEAYYSLENVEEYIESCILDVVRATIPKLNLYNVFSKKNEVAIPIIDELQVSLRDYGYDVVKVLVIDVEPNENVKLAMNRVNAAEKEKIAAEYESEAQRIRIVTIAKAEAEVKKIQMQDMAEQKINPLNRSKESLRVMHGFKSDKSSSVLVFLPSSSPAVSEILNDLMSALDQSNLRKNVKRKSTPQYQRECDY